MPDPGYSVKLFFSPRIDHFKIIGKKGEFKNE